MSVQDTAVGAILEIPDDLLTKIKSAESHIKSLGETSERVARDVSGHWSTIATTGFDTFIQKIAETQRAMQGINGANINLNVNTQPLENQLNNASDAAKKIASDVSETVQKLSLNGLDFTNIERLAESIKLLNGTYEQVAATIKSLEHGRNVQETESAEARQTTNMIQLLKEYLELKKKSEEQMKTKTTVFDQTILDQQKTLLQQILQYQKDINAESKRQERVTAIGGTIPQSDIDKLKDYKEKLDRLTESYNNLKGKIDEMSTAGQAKFNATDVKADLALTRERTDAQDKLNQALQMTSKYTSETKLKSAGISSREEGIYMNEQVTVYRQMIELIKRRGEVEAQIASQGYSATSAQTNLLQTIQTEYDRLNTSLSQVSGKYTEIDRAVKSTFENTKTMQEAENAAKLADAYQKAAIAAEKKRKAEAKTEQTDLSKDKTEYKQVIALIEKMQEAWRKMQTALANPNLPDNLAQQLKSQVQSAEAAMDTLYRRKAEIEAKRGAELADIQNQHEAKKGAAAVAEHERAEKEKTRISKQEATDRYNEEMRQARLQNQALTAQGKQQRISINDAKEKRAIELAQQREKEVERLRKEIENLDKTDANYQKNLDRLNQRINELLGTTQRRVTYTREEAMAMAKSATTLREYENAYKALREAIATTDPTKKKEWQELNTQLQQTKSKIDEIKKKMGEFQSQTQKTSNMMNQLQGRIAAAFSIGAITGFIKKMTEVRAQFELQRVALGAILQDKDKANKIFLEVQQMALQSPFTIMQLERATKQIAAFGFEADKLKTTLKMLADMSAGLGVEIDRLVLVMGHLRARNYLEGTMVRQFTNAGFNVLGELAKYYTELEGRMVSVAEVQSRVKKKMVEFADVEEVLKRVTSAGGMFYDMQKKQSESLYGQMQRISDAYDLMLNEIGKDNQNMIAKALTLIRTLISHWRMLAPTLKQIGYLMAGVFAVRGVIAMIYQMNKLGVVIQTLATNWRLVGLAAGKAATSMKLAMASTGIGALIAGVVAAITVLQGLNAEAKALNEELGRIGEDSVKNLNESIAQFKLLADTMSNSNKTYVERKEAMKEMKRVYSEILPQEKMEIGYIESLNGNYSELMDTISEYYRAKEYQQKYDAVLASQQAKDVQDEIERVFKRMNKDQSLGLIFSDAQIKAWAEKLANELNTGKLPNSIDAMKKRVQEIFPDAKNIGNYFSESYGKADFSDVEDKVEKVRKAFGDISLSTTEAENALAMYNAQINRMDFGQLDSEQDKIAVKLRQIKTSLDNINNLPQTSDQNVLEQRAKMVEQLTIEYENYSHALDSIAEAKGKVLAKEFYDEIEAETKEIQKVYQEYWRLGVKMRDLKTQGKEMTPEFAKLKKEQEECGKSADALADKFGLGNDMSVSNGFLDAAETSYELGEKMKLVAQRAFPTLAEKAQENIDKFKIAILKGEKTWWSFLGSLKSILPEGWTKEWGDIAAKIGATEAEINALSSEAGPAKNKVDELSDSMGKLYSDISKDVAKKHGANFERLNTIMSDSSKVAKDMATELRNEAKALNETTKAYDAAKKKGQAYVDSFLEGQQKTAAEIEQMKKDAQAFTEAADRLWIDEKKTGGKGKDPILELWKNRIKALQDYYKAREKARKNLSTSETESQQRMSFEQLWKELGFDTLKGLSLNELIAQGFDPKKLQADLVLSLEQLKTLIPNKYADVKKEIERTVAKEKIEIEFKIKEGEREQLQKSITEMFDNYALTKELSKLGVSVDLTYMVGGKPTTLDDIRDEYSRLMVDFANKSEEEQKIIKKMGEDLQKKELDNRKKQLDNYVKYLTESMGERAQIEIKAIQDVNKIREDETLDAFSKEQAIMQRRKKMYEDLSKKDMESLKSSDVYISAFKDLESASKTQLQYVLNRLRELQSTFKDLSPAQVKSIANEMKKIEDVLADKDSVRNLGSNLSDAIRYARQRNDLLREQTTLQEDVEANEKMLAAAQVELTRLQLNLKGIQDESSDEWREANDAVLDQQRIVADLESHIEGVRYRLTKVTDEINKGEAAWKGWKKGISNLRQGMNELKSSFDTIYDGLDSMGLVNDAFRDTYESIGDLLGGLDTFLGGLESISITNPFSVITGSIKAIGGIAQTIGAAFGFGDKKKERDIQKLVEKVDTLEKSYEKLEKSIEAAYAFSDYKAGYAQMQSTLNAEKTAYEEMLALEKSKKKTDKEKVKEYEEALEEIAEKQKELQKSLIEDFGSTTDYRGAAEDFVSAWLDAFKETGDGLDALNENWQEFIQNLFIKQAAMAKAGEVYKDVIDIINNAITSGKTDFALKDAIAQAQEAADKGNAYMNDYLKALAEAFNIRPNANGELILSDLQKGIQNITEPQAAAIEAYLNSMRFAVFRHTEQLDTLIATIQMQYGSGAENPVVTELKGIRGVLDSIDRRLGSVIKTSMGQTGIVIARS